MTDGDYFNSDDFNKKPLGFCNRCGVMVFKSETDEHGGYCIDCRTWRLKWYNRLHDDVKEYFGGWLTLAPILVGLFFLIRIILNR